LGYFFIIPILPSAPIGTLDEKVTFYRKEKRLSQEQRSEKVAISHNHLSTIERGMTFVSAELLERLSESLEIPACYFL
jgi:transcriptional regulator with XRE-family HTH domain